MNRVLFLVLTLFLATGIAQAKSVLFIHDWRKEGSIDNTDWNGYSSLSKMLERNGFKVEEKNPSAINLNLLEKYDVVVFSPSWDSRTISYNEANAFLEYVNRGGGLLLMGQIGAREDSMYLLQSLNRIGKPMGVQFKYVTVCDSKMHYYIRNDPDNGVDIPIIVKENMVNHSITKNVDSFAIIWGCSLKLNYPFKAIAFTTEDGWGDTNSVWMGDINDWYCVNDDFEAVGKLPVLAAGEVGKGRVVAIGDGGMFCNEWLDNYGHEQLALNIFNWLTT